MGFHKVMLYAHDNAAFLMQDPVESLIALKVVLTQFAQVSGFKINKSQSVLMGLSLPVEV